MIDFDLRFKLNFTCCLSLRPPTVTLGFLNFPQQHDRGSKLSPRFSQNCKIHTDFNLKSSQYFTYQIWKSSEGWTLSYLNNLIENMKPFFFFYSCWTNNHHFTIGTIAHHCDSRPVLAGQERGCEDPCSATPHCEPRKGFHSKTHCTSLCGFSAHKVDGECMHRHWLSFHRASVSPSMKLCQKRPSGFLRLSKPVLDIKVKGRPWNGWWGRAMVSLFSLSLDYLSQLLLKWGHDGEERNREIKQTIQGARVILGPVQEGDEYHFPSFLPRFLGKQSENWPTRTLVGELTEELEKLRGIATL